MEKIKKDIVYSKKEIMRIILSSNDNKISDVAVHKKINKMINSGKLSRVGNGQYVFCNKKMFNYDIPLKILDKLKNRFDVSAKYIVYDSTVLNMFLNHLIGRNTVIVEAEKNIVGPVFWFLKEEGFEHVLLNPSENENYMYNPYDGSGIIVKTMVSKAPIDNKDHKITIEKLVVDIVCDKTINMFYEGAEIPHMVENILDNYAVKFDTIRNYAKRRHCLDKFINYVPDDLKGAFRD